MNRRTALLAPFLLIAATLPVRAEIIPLEEISLYLNGIDTAVTPFTQTNADGSTSTGMLYIKRPGRARFEYTAPNKALVLAGAGNVAIFDDKSNQPPEQYPLRRTPLNLILAETVNLDTADMVIGHREDNGTTRVVAQDPKNPEYGSIELVFGADPVALSAWIITDDLGNRTVVELEELTRGTRIREAMFDIRAEIKRREGD